jgi:O-antigen ligase
MPNYPHFSDYEPLTRGKGLRESQTEREGGLAEAWPMQRDSAWKQSNDSHLAPAVKLKARDANHPGKEKVTRSSENWLQKRGHTLTFVGLLLFTFLVFFRPYEWSPALAWLSSSAFIVAIVTLALYVPTQLALENKITTRLPEVKLVLLLLLACFISIVVAMDRLLAWTTFTDYFKVVVIFIVLVNVLRTEKRLKALFFLVLTASCVLSITAFKNYTSGNLALRGERIAGAIGGLFENPNDFALHLVTMIPLSIALLLGSRGGIKKTFYAACAFLAVVGVVMSFSRGGFLGMASALAVLGWRLSRKTKFIIPVALAMALALVIIAAPSDYRARLSTTNDGSATARSDDLKRSIYVAIHHPIIGVGIGNYVLYSNSNHATHNAYTQVASEVGLAAAGVYLMFLLVPLKGLRRISQEIDVTGTRSALFYLAVGLEASFIGYMVSSFFASVAYVWYIYYLVGYAICLRRLYDTSKTSLQAPAVSAGSTEY